MKKITTNTKDLEFVCDEVDYKEGIKIGKELEDVCKNEIRKKVDICGLAHNQIGGDKRVFVAHIDNDWKTFINPIIIKESGEIFEHKERCMSFTKKKHENKVPRHSWIILRYQVGEFQWVDESFQGFDSCCMQHEMDHLDGIHIFNKKGAAK